MSETPDSNWQNAFEVFKWMYEQAAQRYENIYRAIWQIFQYMALLSAGILTFGSKDSRFPNEVIVFIALSPLIFWFLATYLPMDRYGQDSRRYLKSIEQDFNENFKNNCSWSIPHYSNFSQQDSSDFYKQNSWLYGWRVRRAVLIFGILILITWSYSGFLIIRDNPTYHSFICIPLIIFIPLSVLVILIDKCLEERIDKKYDKKSNENIRENTSQNSAE